MIYDLILIVGKEEGCVFHREDNDPSTQFKKIFCGRH